jgi:CRP/FNR family transcriptional regulator, dissimilatory nitrate respiration regulator
MDLSFLTRTQLFRGVREDEIEKMLDCMGAVQKHFDRGAGIYRSGDIVQSMGLVLSGSVNIESYDFDGKKSILGHSTDGQLFAETYACIPGEPLMVNVTAAESTDVLFLNVQRMMQLCPSLCPFHNKLIMNLFTISAQKNLNLSWRILHTSPKRIRERLYSYLLFQSKKQGANDFTIPFDRQQLADYLNIDRSAMSHELGKMQKEGLLFSEKNHFTLLK